MRFSNNSKINQLVIQLLRIGWRVRKKKRRHFVLIAPNNRRMAIPSTPSDYRAFDNFFSSVKKLMS